MDHRTRVVECAECSEATAYVEVPDGASIVSDGLSNGVGIANCLSCGHEFSVPYAGAE